MEFFRSKFITLPLLLSVLGGSLLAQTQPTVTVTATQPNSSRDGSLNNPFNGTGFILGRDIQDPDPNLPYVTGGWAQSHSPGFCPGTFQFFGLESDTPTLVFPRVESGVANITITVFVQELAQAPVQAQRTFFVEPPPGSQGCPNFPPDLAELSSLSNNVPLGSTINLTGRAMDDDSSALTLLFYESSTGNPAVKGTLFAQRNAVGCQFSTCSGSVTFPASSIPTTHFFQVDVDDGQNVVSSDKLPVLVTISGGDPPPPPTPMSCQCGNTLVVVDAGPTSLQLLGGETLNLEGTATGDDGGAGVLTGIFLWSITNDAGLGSNLTLNGSTFLDATLETPDINQDAVILVELEASFGGCACQDSIAVTLLADPPPAADLALEVVDDRDPVVRGRQVNYTLNVTNNGPEAAPNVVLMDFLPNDVTFESASAGCSLDGQMVVCNLGSLANGAESEVTISVLADSIGLLQNQAFVNSDMEDSNEVNNTAFESTVVESPRFLYFAQFGDGSDLLFSQIVLFNLDSEFESDARISLLDDDGMPLSVDLNGMDLNGQLNATIPPSGMRSFLSDGMGDLAVGSVTVDSDTQLAGTIIFGGAVGLAGVPSSSPLPSGFIAPIETFGNPPTINTGIAVMNLGPDQVTLQLRLTDSDNGEIATGQITLPGLGHTSLFVNQVMWNTAVDFSDFAGLLEVTSDGTVAATAIQTRPGQFATLPVVPIP